MRSWKWLLSYVTMASLGLGFALVISLKFVRAAHSQSPSNSQAPSSGDLPPEFLNETGGPTPAAPTAATPPNTAATPAPATSATPSSPPKLSPVPAENPSIAAAPSVTPSAAPSAAAIPSAAASAAQNLGTAQNPTAKPPSTPANAAAAQPTDPNAPENITAPAPVPRMGNEDYTYDPTGRRDPFKPYRTLQMIQAKPPPSTSASAGASSNEPQIPLEPLQRWDLERLKVIGILWEVRAPKAMVRDPDGVVYTVMKNSKVGRYSGYVAAIREGEVVVIETLEYDGQSKKETKILELGK
jgi:type IV pilus assembly protein PilP